ncbi:MAG TPA: hypothetical protein VFK06_17675 [Candidatus Angelobacter sp.]|nr:hypothetical protein [Candidatus Angelobacter sp.]
MVKKAEKEKRPERNDHEGQQENKQRVRTETSVRILGSNGIRETPFYRSEEIEFRILFMEFTETSPHWLNVVFAGPNHGIHRTNVAFTALVNSS